MLLTKYKLNIVFITTFTIVINTSIAQKDSMPNIDDTYPSFRIKSEIVKLSGLNPNIYVDYKIDSLFGLNLGVLYYSNGIIWTAPHLMINEFDPKELLSKGLGFDFGIKFYTNTTKYISINFETKFLNYSGYNSPSESQNRMYMDLTRNDYQIKLFRGFENEDQSKKIREIYFGVGLLIIDKTYKYQIYSGMPVPPEIINGKKEFTTLTFHFGYNLGRKLVHKSSNNNKTTDRNDLKLERQNRRKNRQLKNNDDVYK